MIELILSYFLTQFTVNIYPITVRWFICLYIQLDINKIIPLMINVKLIVKLCVCFKGAFTKCSYAMFVCLTC